MLKEVVLGENLTLEEFIQVVRYHVPVSFSDEYVARVKKSRLLVEKWIDEERPMYGVTTGFGVLCSRSISKEQAALLQKNILLTHAVSVGRPLREEVVRGIMLMVLQNLGQGYSGVRMDVLEMYKEFLNRDIYPWVPGAGSVGYLSAESHLALVLIGEGKAWVNGELMPGKEALIARGLEPIKLEAKEGLALVSGTTSPTAMAAVSLADLITSVKSADIIGALSLENNKGLLRAFDPRIMKVRPHKTQGASAENVRRILADSQVIEKAKDTHLQDALSLRCIPQLHGSAKKLIYDARETIEIEMNSCCDNPIIWPEEGEEDVISACNADSSFVGMAMDSCCVAAAGLAKMSERRTNRLIDGYNPDYPAFMIRNPGLNSGLMVTQYTQAGLINDIRALSYPSTVDNTPTCAGQEDYVAMGYNACRKAVKICDKVEYVLAIELLANYEAQSFADPQVPVSSVSKAIYDQIGKVIPLMHEDEYLYPHIEYLKGMIHRGELLRLVEEQIGALK